MIQVILSQCKYPSHLHHGCRDLPPTAHGQASRGSGPADPLTCPLLSTMLYRAIRWPTPVRLTSATFGACTCGDGLLATSLPSPARAPPPPPPGCSSPPARRPSRWQPRPTPGAGRRGGGGRAGRALGAGARPAAAGHQRPPPPAAAPAGGAAGGGGGSGFGDVEGRDRGRAGGLAVGRGRGRVKSMPVPRRAIYGQLLRDHNYMGCCGGLAPNAASGMLQGMLQGRR